MYVDIRNVCACLFSSQRAHSTCVHEDKLLIYGCELTDQHALYLVVKGPPKLVVVSIDAEKSTLSSADNDVKLHFK